MTIDTDIRIAILGRVFLYVASGISEATLTVIDSTSEAVAPIEGDLEYRYE